MKKKDFALCIMKVVLRDYEDNNGILHVDNSLSFTTIENNKLIRENKNVFESSIDHNLIFQDTILNIAKSFNPKNRIKPTLALIQLDYGNGYNQRHSALINGLWIRNNNGEISVVMKNEEMGTYYDVLISPSCKMPSDIVENYYTHYSCLGNSPSGERRQMILVGSDQYNWEEIIDNASDGFLTLNRGNKTYVKMAKESAKLFQCLAGSVSFGTCKRIAIYFDKFNENKFDGMCYGSSEAFVDHIKSTFDFNVSPRATNGIFLQGRIAQGKYGCILLPNNMVWSKIKLISKKNNAEIIQMSFADAFDINLNPDNYVGKIVVIGNKHDPIDVFMDSNTLKSVYDYSKKPEYTVLRILKNDSVIHYSSTMFAKSAFKNLTETYKMAKKLFANDIRDAARKQIKSEGRVLGLDTFDNNLFMRDVLVGAFPEYVRRDPNIALDCINNIVESANKKVQKLNFAAKGSNKGIVVGPENLLLTNESLLGEFELYCKGFQKMFEQLNIPEEERFVVGVKFPTMDVDEYEIYNCLSLDTIYNRLDTLIENETARETFKKEYMMYQSSMAVMPCTETFKEKHAGSDFDTDAMQFFMLITDKALEIIKTTKPDMYEEMIVYNQLYHTLQHEPAIIKINQ